MCTLAIYFRVIPGYPAIIAANRDEYFARPAAAPILLSDKPRIVAGKDLRAGGTWLGVNEHGLIAGLLNRRAERADPRLRSRGLLCLDALRSANVSAALQLLSTLHGADYNPFNLLVATRHEAAVAYNRAGDGIECVKLEPGVHLLTNLDVNDFECPKISRSYERFAALAADREFTLDPVGQRDKLRALLADHATPLDPRSSAPNAICLHLDGYGTRSSSLLFLGDDPARTLHFFAPGPPCEVAYEPALVPTASVAGC